MARITRTEKSIAEADKQEVLTLIRTAARQLSRKELRALGDQFHDMARQHRQSDPPAPAPEEEDGEVWL